MQKVFDKAIDGLAQSLGDSQLVNKENLGQFLNKSVDIGKEFEKSEQVLPYLKHKDEIVNAFAALPEDLALTLTKRVDRFFKKPGKYQEENLKSFVDGLVNTIDHYILPPTPSDVVDADDSDEEVVAKEYTEIRNDVLVNIALALASLIIFYPLVLAITSRVQGHSFGFYRVNDGRNELDEDLSDQVEDAKQKLGAVINTPAEAKVGEMKDESVGLSNSL